MAATGTRLRYAGWPPQAASCAGHSWMRHPPRVSDSIASSPLYWVGGQFAAISVYRRSGETKRKPPAVGDGAHPAGSDRPGVVG